MTSALAPTSGWFAAAPAARLAVLRVATGIFALWYLLSRLDMFASISRDTPVELFDPVGLARWLSAPLTEGAHEVALLAMTALAVLYTLGVGFRVTGPLFAIVLAFVLSYRNSWSMVYHSNNALVLQVLVIALAPSARVLSVDALFSGRFWSRESGSRFGWPVRLIIAVTTSTYLLAGIAKIAGPLGWSWALGANLRGQVAVDALRKDMFGSSASPLAYDLYGEVWVFTLLGLSSLIIELGAPLALLHRRLAWVWAVSAFGMHWGIYAIMGIEFRYCLSGVIFLCCFPVERIAFALHSLWGVAAGESEGGASLRGEVGKGQASG